MQIPEKYKEKFDSVRAKALRWEVRNPNCQQVVTMLSFDQVVTRLSLTTF